MQRQVAWISDFGYYVCKIVELKTIKKKLKLPENRKQQKNNKHNRRPFCEPINY